MKVSFVATLAIPPRPLNDYLDQLNIYVDQLNIYLDQSNVYLDQSNVYLDQSNIYLDQSNVYLDQSNIYLDQLNVYLDQLNINCSTLLVQPYPHVPNTHHDINSVYTFSVVDVGRWYNEPGMYDFISCLNVLDRCDSPLSMLRQIHGKLRPGGLFLLTMVLPYQPFVEKGTNASYNF